MNLSNLFVEDADYTWQWSAARDILSSNSIKIMLALCVVTGATRILSSFLGRSKKLANGTRIVPMLPYWLPVVGHIGNIATGPSKFFTWATSIYRQGLFSVNIFGATHYIIFDPTYATSFINQNRSVADSDGVGKHIMKSVFAWPREDLGPFEVTGHDIHDCYRHLSADPGLRRLTNAAIENIRSNISDMVALSFTKGQARWARQGNATVFEKPDGDLAVECSFEPLIRHFTAACANPGLFGTDFCKNFPEYATDVFAMDRAFFLMAASLPAWTPIPQLRQGLQARQRLFDAMLSYSLALEKHMDGDDSGELWRNLDDVSDLIKARVDTFRRHRVPMDCRASYDIALVWAMNANANPLIFWMLNRVCADKDLLKSIRREIASHVTLMPSADQNKPAEIEAIDHEALANQCPILKSCYVECLRVDVQPWSSKVMQQDLALSVRKQGSDKFLLKSGCFTHVAHELHHMDPNHFPNPKEWRHDRHLRTVGDKTTADMGTVRSFGGGQSMCKGRAFAHREILVYFAAIVSVWEIEPAGGGPWKIPRPKKTPATNATKDDVKVWISPRRQISS